MYVHIHIHIHIHNSISKYIYIHIYIYIYEYKQNTSKTNCHTRHIYIYIYVFYRYANGCKCMHIYRLLPHIAMLLLLACYWLAIGLLLGPQGNGSPCARQGTTANTGALLALRCRVVVTMG